MMQDSEDTSENLYQASLRLSNCREVSDSLALVLLTMDSTQHQLSDSLRYYINKKIDNSAVNYATIIEGFRVSLNLSRTVYASLIQQLKAVNNSILADAGFYNNLVTNAGELPEINDASLNEVEIMFEEGGLDNILPYFEQIDGIAHQCPYQGGPAVYRSRYFLSLFNDSIEYDDAAICLSQGISRQHSQTNKILQPILLVQPNPANNEIEVHVEGLDNSYYQLKIISQEGRILKDLKLQQQSSAIRISTLDIAPGVYYLEAIIDQKNICRSKLVVVR